MLMYAAAQFSTDSIQSIWLTDHTEGRYGQAEEQTGETSRGLDSGTDRGTGGGREGHAEGRERHAEGQTGGQAEVQTEGHAEVQKRGGRDKRRCAPASVTATRFLPKILRARSKWLMYRKESICARRD